MHPPPIPAWANFTLMIECTPESDYCYSVYCTLWCHIGLITLLGNVTEENRVVKIIAVVLFIICSTVTPTVPHIFCPWDYILHYSCVPYTRFDNLTRKCNRGEQGCQNFGCSFVYYLCYSHKICFKNWFIAEHLFNKF